MKFLSTNITRVLALKEDELSEFVGKVQGCDCGIVNWNEGVMIEVMDWTELESGSWSNDNKFPKGITVKIISDLGKNTSTKYLASIIVIYVSNLRVYWDMIMEGKLNR